MPKEVANLRLAHQPEPLDDDPRVVVELDRLWSGQPGNYLFTPKRSCSRRPNLDEALQSMSVAQISQSISDPNAIIAPGYQPNVMPQNFGQTLTPPADSLTIRSSHGGTAGDRRLLGYGWGLSFRGRLVRTVRPAAFRAATRQRYLPGREARSEDLRPSFPCRPPPVHR
jgi:hypothetical protein